MKPPALGEAAADWSASRWVFVEGRRVRYRAAGAGPPVVLVHGLGVSADYWVRNAAVVAAAGYRVLAPDLPGFGRTRGPAGGLDVHGQAAAVHAFARAVGIGPAVYVGHSLSCQAVIELAADHPDEVRGLVLASPTGEGGSVVRLFRQGLGLIRDLRRESLALAMLVAQAYLRAGPLRILRTWHMGARHDPLPTLTRVRCPGLVILGKRDPVVGVDFAQRVADALPHGRIVLIDASHGVIFDLTGEFNAAVVTFLGEVAGGVNS